MAILRANPARWAVAAVLLLASRGRAETPVDGAATPCLGAGDSISVVTHRRELWLCHEGVPRGPFPVALGRGGVDKRREGDGRTPVGSYLVGAPRASEQYGTFIPIDYPTPQQLAEGYTGSAIGIHGPPRGKFESERWTTTIDWTLGCIATGDDRDLQEIADFVGERQLPIVIR